MLRASLMAQRLKRLPAIWETWVRSLGQEDPLEKEMATHSSILAWRIPWMEEPGGLQSMGSQSRTRLSDFTFTHIVLKITYNHVVLVVKNLPANAGDARDASLIPGLGRSPEGGNGTPLHYSCQEKPLDRGV